MKTKIIAVANQKGGVGKTTTAVNLAASLSYAGNKTLLIDLDPQGNASGGLGIDRHTSATIYDVLISRRELVDCIQATALPNLLVIPANQNLIGAEVELINAISREKKLKIALKKLPEDYQFVVFDCPPSLGLLTINAFTASDSILIPTQCEYYAMEGLGQLLNTYQIVKEDLNEGLEIEGVLLTMFDSRNKLTHEVVKEMKEYFPDKLFETVIPRNVKLSESPSFGKPILLYDPESKGCVAYYQLARELMRRNGLETESLPELPKNQVEKPKSNREEAEPSAEVEMAQSVTEAQPEPSIAAEPAPETSTQAMQDNESSPVLESSASEVEVVETSTEVSELPKESEQVEIESSI